MAGRIREQVLDSGLNLSTEDASYIATAIAYRADSLHSFDSHHLRLNGHPAVNGLVICKPKGQQTLLGL